MPIAPENLPFLRFPRVFHVGSLEPASRTDRASLEGPCLSVSVHPEEWGHIARVSGTQWALSCPRAIWLDAVALTDAMLAEMTDWAIGKGLGERRTAWRAWYHDGESDDWRYMLCETEEQARDEAEGWHGDPDDADAPGPDGTAVEPVTAFRLTDHALSLLERWNDPLNGIDALPILYSMLELAPVMPDLAGTWWNETEDPESLSCPRGGILPGRLDMFDIRDPAGKPPPFRREGTPERRPFYSTCVGWPAGLMAAKEFLDENGEEIGRADFLKLVDAVQMRRIEAGLGYGGRGGLRMDEDWHVRYFREPETGIPFFVHSATEHVFAKPGEIEALQLRMDAPEMPEPGVLLIRSPGALTGQPGEHESDAFDLMLDRLIRHEGPVLILDDEEGAEIPPQDRLVMTRAIDFALSSGWPAALLWHDNDPPEGWKGHGDEVPGTDSREILSAFLERSGATAVLEEIAPAEAEIDRPGF